MAIAAIAIISILMMTSNFYKKCKKNFNKIVLTTLLPLSFVRYLKILLSIKVQNKIKFENNEEQKKDWPSNNHATSSILPIVL